MGRMSPLHNPAAGITEQCALVPASRNGGSSNAAVNGNTIDLLGKRGVHFNLVVGALTGAANYLAYLQNNDLPTDPANGNWANVNTTTYSNAGLTVKTNASTAWGLDYIPGPGMSTAVRIVLVPDANISLIGCGANVF
jgi:hypothetical protein